MTQEQLKDALATAEADLKAFKEPILAYEEQIAELKGDIESMFADRDAITSDIKKMDADIKSKTEQLENETDPDVQAKIQAEIDELSKQKDASEAKRAELEKEIDETKEEVSKVDAAIEAWRSENEEQLEVLERAVEDIQSQIVTPEQQIWTKIGKKFNEGLAHLDTKNNDQLDEALFGASGLVQEAKSYTTGQLNRTKSEYEEHYQETSEQQNRQLRRVFNQYITEVFQQGGDNAAMDELFTEQIFAEWVSSGQGLASYFAEATIKALKKFEDFEVQQGQEGDLKGVFTAAYSDSINLLEDTKANLEARIESTQKEIEDRQQKYDATRAKQEAEKDKLNAERESVKGDIDTLQDELESSIGTPNFVGAAKALYEAETRLLDLTNRVQSLEVQIANNEIAHNMTTDALKAGKSNLEKELAETNKEKAVEVASLETLIAEYEEAKADQEAELKKVSDEKTAREEKSAIIKAELAESLDNSSRIFDEIYEQWNNMDDEDPAKTALTADYQTAEANLAEAEWNRNDFNYNDNLAFHRLDRDINQLKAEIDAIVKAIAAFQDLVDSHTPDPSDPNVA